MATPRPRWVNPAADGTGDGTTNGLTGPTSAYNGLQACETAEQIAGSNMVGLDEYLHILSGAEWIKSGSFAEISSGSQYMRGSYVSVLAGIVQWLIPGSIFAIKMIPVTISALSWIVWRKIAIHIFKKIVDYFTISQSLNG